jgi:riboflavin kinase/FMN adenylyltransferase
MRWIEDAAASEELPQGAVATLGNYDGVHRGQQAILSRVVARARELGLPSAVVTFDPHPLAVLNPERCPARLTTREQKARLLDAQGIDHVLEIRFTRSFAATSAGDFVRGFLRGRLLVREVFVGSRFVFGRAREGDLASLVALGAEVGLKAVGVPEVLEDGAPVSSSRIRDAVAAGDVEEAARLLGRPFDILGTIVHGQERGAALGWPTINLATDNELLPRNGVYTSRVHLLASGETREAVSNVGTRPTFSGIAGKPMVESHILDFARNVYGERVELAFLARLRDEQRFPSTTELARQIGRDIEAARQFFARRAHGASGSPRRP